MRKSVELSLPTTPKIFKKNYKKINLLPQQRRDVNTICNMLHILDFATTKTKKWEPSETNTINLCQM